MSLEGYTKYIIVHGFYGFFTAMHLADKYGPVLGLIGLVAAGIYWWPESKIFLLFAAGMVAFMIGLLALLVVIGTIARWVGYEPELDFGMGLEAPKED